MGNYNSIYPPLKLQKAFISTLQNTCLYDVMASKNGKKQNYNNGAKQAKQLAYNQLRTKPFLFNSTTKWRLMGNKRFSKTLLLNYFNIKIYQTNR